MLRNNPKDISNRITDYTYISLMSQKIKIGVIGGGKAGEIKTKHFIKNKCKVEVLSKEFSDEIINLSKINKEYLKLIQSDFYEDFLKDKHIIIIAVNDEKVSSAIKEYCTENCKIYIDSTDFTKGLGIVPVERSTENINIAVSTKGGNPKGAVFVCEKSYELLKGYDDFIKITTIIRNNAKNLEQYKKEIFKIIYSDDFKIRVENNDYIEYLEETFPKVIVKELLKDIIN